jgi:NADH dehydrogenase
MAQKPRLVILGGGFAGAYCAQALCKRLDSARADVFLIDRHNFFVFYPLLVEAGTGSLEPRHAVVSVRDFVRQGTFRMAEIMEVDTAGQTVTVRGPDSEVADKLSYEQLVLAIGSVTRFPNVPGLREFGFPMKELTDAVTLRDRAISMLEKADATEDPNLRKTLLHLVVVGGNFTGVEVAGEFDVFLKEASRHYPRLSPAECKVSLVEIADRILPALDRDLSDYATRQMRRRGIDVLLSDSVEELQSDRALLASGKTLFTQTVIWCAGIAANPLAGVLPFPLDDRGYILCEPDLRVRGHENVWGIGDCAINPDPTGKPYPATAQNAVQQGVHLALNLRRALQGEPSIVFSYSSKGSLAALGCRTGVAKVFGLKISGFPAWFLWRTVYLLKMPGWSRRIRVALDWALGLLFKRDVVQLGLHRRGGF